MGFFFLVDPRYLPPQLHCFCLEGAARAVKSLSTEGFCTEGKHVTAEFS